MPRITMISTILLILCGFLTYRLVGHSVYGGSIDFVAHLSLVEYIVDVGIPRWHSPTSVDMVSNLSIMSFYPPVAHAAAAGLARTVGSAPGGMTAVASLAVFVFYAVACSAMFRARCPIGAALLLATAFVLAANRFLHGAEVIGNFFLAQIVGVAGMAAALYLCVVLLEGWLTVAVAIGSAYALGWTYLLSEVEFCIAFLFALLAAPGPHLLSAVARQRLLQFTVAGVGLSLVTLLHPQLEVMRAAAVNDGSIEPSLDFGAIAALAALSLLSSVAVRLDMRAEARRPVLFFCALGAGAGSVALVQYGAWTLFHAGSPYAVRKLVFDLCTALALLACYSVGASFSRALRLDRTSSRSTALLSAPLALLITLSVFHGWGREDIRPFGRIFSAEKELRNRAQPDVIGHTASLITGMAPHIGVPIDGLLNMAMDYVLFRDDLTKAIDYAASHHLEEVRFAIVRTDDTLALKPSCHRGFTVDPGLVLIDYACAILPATEGGS